MPFFGSGRAFCCRFAARRGAGGDRFLTGAALNVAFLICSTAFAATGTIQLRTGVEPAALCTNTPNTISIALQVADLSDAINTVQARISYDTSKLSLSIGGTVDSAGWSRVALLDSGGNVTYSLVRLGGSVGPGAGPFTVGTLLFNTVGGGTTSIGFQADAPPLETKLTTADLSPVVISGANLTKTPSGSIVINPTVTVNIELGGGVMAAGPITRCITLNFWDCGVSISAPVYSTSVAMSFASGLGTAAVSVPCGTYTCITARDRLHTLRRTATPTGAVGNQVVNFTGAFSLTGGNLNDDKWIDILDFGIYTTQDLTSQAASTNCSVNPPTRNCDISGDGIVNSTDFGFIANHFLAMRDLNCCGAANLFGGDEEKLDSGLNQAALTPALSLGERGNSDGPVQAISVADLRRLGMSDVARADLNSDGWLDAVDVSLWMQGVRPGTRPVRPIGSALGGVRPAGPASGG